MQAKTILDNPLWPRPLSAVLGLYALFGGAISFSGWALDIPRLTDWVNDDVSIQPNAAVLMTLAGAAVLLQRFGQQRVAIALGGLVALAGALTLLQYIIGANFGFNHQLLFGRTWGQGTTLTPGRVGPPASISFLLIGTALVMLGLRGPGAIRARRIVPIMGLAVCALMMFSLMGYLFGARNFYSIPWLSAIALQTATMLLALAIGLIVSVPEHQPVLTLRESSGAGALARLVIPVLVVLPIVVGVLPSKGEALGLYDEGTGRALASVLSIFITVGLMWWALLSLRRREERERDADRRKDEFLATLAHELRNPLAPIRNALSVLKVARDDREVLDRARAMMERQVGQMVRLIDDLLDVSRISRGKLKLRRERVELAPMIRQAAETCRPMAECARHEITLTLPPQPLYLNADPIRLTQVFSNLLDNACKFTKDAGRISLSVERQGSDVVVAVKDNGIGISRDKIDSIFELFSQVDRTLEKSQGGLGIGLTLVKRLVELHGGSIEVRSEGLGKGSEFIVRLPLVIELRSWPEEPEEVIRPSGKRRILVVDDNRDSAESLAMLLRVTGNEAYIAYDGEEAVKAAANHRPDVILLDIGLPRLNGYDACRRIREQPWAKKIILIAVTGWGQDEDRRKSAEAGFNGHLVKPVHHVELTKLLASLLPEMESQLTER
jgi:signal transduction histidine kinase/CheY-like chemotaxis protein